MNERQTMEYIKSLDQYGVVPGLYNMRALCLRLGGPQERLKFVHIAGTNGKGSVLAYVSAALCAAGYRVGRYLSPTIFTYRERIQVNGRMISRNDLCAYVERVREACGEMTAEGLPHPTPFEFETALSFLYFAEKNCDVVVLETGMGGRLDATNVIPSPLVAVFASVSMDHMKFLGETLGEIAAEKAGIIKNGCFVISAAQREEAARAIEEKAQREGCPLRVADGGKAARVRYGVEVQRFDYGGYRDLEITLAGKFQIENAVLALETLEALGEAGVPVKEEALRRGLKEAAWPGRFSVIGKKPLFIADGAHNEDAARKLADSIRFYFTNKKIIYIMGILRDKEYEKIIAETCSCAEQIITVAPPENARALPAYELALAVKQYHPNVTAAGSVEEAVEMAYLLAEKDDVIISFGSLSYLGRLIRTVENRKSSGKAGTKRRRREK